MSSSSAAVDDFEFDDLLGEQNLSNPFPMLAQLRERDPVHWNPRFGAWMLTRYQDVRDAFQNRQVFGSDDRQSWLAMTESLSERERESALRALPLLADIPVRQDGPGHARQRLLVSRAFTQERIAPIRPAIERRAEALLDQLEPAGQFDLISEYAHPLSLQIIFELLGFPEEKADAVRRWAGAHRQLAVSLFSGDSTLVPESTAQLDEERRFLTTLVAERRCRPGPDLISQLIRASEHGDRLSDPEIVILVHFLLLVAGHETTASLISLGTLELLRRPAVWERLRREPALLPGAITELARYVSPVFLLPRVLKRDFILRGRTMRAGQGVYLMIGAANHDPEVFDDPETLDVGRGGGNSLAFGHGAHFCLGAQLANLEAMIAIGALLRRLPGLRQRAEGIEFERSCVVRTCKEVPMTIGAGV
jgi:cytochrome P450